MTVIDTSDAPDVEGLIYRPGVYLVEITPEVASKLLDRNTENRTRKDTAIERYERDMKAGKWRVTNQGLGFDKKGVLADGQNRLAACVAAGVPFTTLIATGLDPEARDVVDTGVKRSLADVLKMAGMSNAVITASGASLRFRYESAVAQRKTGFTWGNRSRLNHEDMLRYVEEHPALHERAKAGWLYKKEFAKMPLSVAVAFESMATEIDGDALADFRHGLITGADLAEGDPILALRNYLIRMSGVRRGGPSPMYLMAITVKTWNDWRHGEQRELIVIRDNEPMPVMDAKPAPKTTWRRRKHQRELAERVALAEHEAAQPEQQAINA